MTQNASNLSQFIQELRNRRVFRVTAVYLGVGYAILESSSIIIPMLGFSETIVKIILATLVIGFPSAVILAWMFQFTPEGIRRSPKSGEKQSADQKPLTSNGIIIALLVVIAVLLAFPRYKEAPEQHTISTPSALVNLKSIAVLPFTPFTDEREDEIFADGMHDDILTQLSKIADLKVISRTSVMQYKGTSKLIPDIASELGVTNILEGSVRRAGDQIRVVAQLINAKTDEHLWAETFDRKYADIFTLQSELAKKIASAMKATLTPEEVTSIEKQPTENLEAYNYYIRGKLSFESFTGLFIEAYKIEDAIKFYQAAIKLDPHFLHAYAGLVEAQVMLLNLGLGNATDNIRDANQNLKRVQEIDPDNPLAHFSVGLIEYYVNSNYVKALAAFDHALSGKPNDDGIMQYQAAVLRRQGRWEESRQLYKKAIDLNPRSSNLIYNAASTSTYLRLWPEVENFADMLILLEPQAGWWYAMKAYARFELTGNPQAALKYMESKAEQGDPTELIEQLLYMASFSNDKQVYRKWMSRDVPSNFYPMYRLHALGYMWFGEDALAKTYFDSLRMGAEAQIVRSPQEERTYGFLGMALVGLGRVQEGIEMGIRGTEVKPLEKDAMDGSGALQALLDIYAMAQNKSKCLDLMEQLLSMPSEFTVNTLKFDPLYEFLHDEPRYNALLKKYGKSSA